LFNFASCRPNFQHVHPNQIKQHQIPKGLFILPDVHHFAGEKIATFAGEISSFLDGITAEGRIQQFTMNSKAVILILRGTETGS
jgi:hypothetical protein